MEGNTATFGSSPDSLPEVTQPSVFANFQSRGGGSPGSDAAFTFEVSALGKPREPVGSFPTQAMHPAFQQLHHQQQQMMRAAQSNIIPAHAAMLPILNPLPAFASPPSSPVPDDNGHNGSSGKRRRRRSSGSDDGSEGGWSDAPRGEDEPMPKWSVNDFESCCRVYDSSTTEIPSVPFRVQVDKGFKYSRSCNAYICQKKNHFQVTVTLQVPVDIAYVATSAGFARVSGLSILMHGIKLETPANKVQLDQSQQDRTKKMFKPVMVTPTPGEVSRITIGRLHFSEPTANNMRKKGKPNPEQRFFALVVTLGARSGDQFYPIASHISERIIVRASNPRQFENETPQVHRSMWIKGSMPNSTFHVGSVGINVEVPDEALCVHGNIRLSGAIMHPSDERIKTDILPLDSREQLHNVRQLGIYHYLFVSPWTQQLGQPGLEGESGIVAQELQRVLPDAVASAGDVRLPDGTVVPNMLMVNRDRLYLENIGATQELAKITDHLTARLESLELENRALLQRLERLTHGSASSPAPRSYLHTASAPLASSLATPQPSLHGFVSAQVVPRVTTMVGFLLTTLLGGRATM